MLNISEYFGVLMTSIFFSEMVYTLQHLQKVFFTLSSQTAEGLNND